MWRIIHCKTFSSLRRACLFGTTNIVMLLVVSSFPVQILRPLQRRWDLASSALIQPRSEFQRFVGTLSYIRNLNSGIQPHGQNPFVHPYSGSSSMALYASFTTTTKSVLGHENDSSMDIGQIRKLVQEAHDIVQRNMQSLTVTKIQLKVCVPDITWVILLVLE